jgi:ABC-type uncharacterized transport system involved in gliding motility auxiliary subunit
MSDSQKTSNLLGSALLCAGLACVFFGQRVFAQDTGQLVVTGLGIVLVLAATVLRALAFTRATGDVRGVEGRLLLAYGAVWLALGLYGLTTDSMLTAFGIEDDNARTEYVAILYSLWITVLAVALAGLLFMELVYARMPIAASVELRRVRTAAFAGLTLALSLIFLLSINYVVSVRDVRRDLSYFKTTEPSQSTLRMLDKLETPVRGILFWRKSDDVLQPTEPYFAALARYSKNFSYEVLDSAYVPELSRKHRVRGNGSVLLLQGEGDKEKGQTFNIGDELTEARPQLRKLDQLFQESFTKLAKPERAVKLTVGHGEFNATPEEGQDSPRSGDGLRVMDQVWTRLNVKTSKITVSDALGGNVAKEAGAVISIGPKQKFLPEEVATLLSYVRGGGRLMLMIDPNADDGLDPLLAGLGLVRRPGTLASDKFHVTRAHDDTDKTLVFSNRYSSHPSVTTASRFANEIATVFVAGAGLGRAPSENKVTPTPKVAFPLRSGPGYFRDLDGDFKRDENEPEESVEMIAAVTVTEKEGAPEGRVIVIGDGDFMTDKVSTNNGNVMVFVDSLAWLIGNEELSAEVSSEEDVPIQHSRDQDKLYFYATTFAVPLPLIALSVWVARRRRRPAENAS